MQVEAVIYGIFDGALERATLRWLLNVPFSPEVRQTILLWILFVEIALRRCQRCSSQFQSQGHVIDCTNLNPVGSLRRTYLEAVRMSPFEYSQSSVSALEESIRSSLPLVLVFGESY